MTMKFARIQIYKVVLEYKEFNYRFNSTTFFFASINNGVASLTNCWIFETIRTIVCGIVLDKSISFICVKKLLILNIYLMTSTIKKQEIQSLIRVSSNTYTFPVFFFKFIIQIFSFLSLVWAKHFHSIIEIYILVQSIYQVM